jgi:hypothetical protein
MSMNSANARRQKPARASGKSKSEAMQALVRGRTRMSIGDPLFAVA